MGHNINIKYNKIKKVKQHFKLEQIIKKGTEKYYHILSKKLNINEAMYDMINWKYTTRTNEMMENMI